MINWASNVNTKARRETNGTVPVGVIADQTRCGRKRFRPANQLAPRKFSVVMKFNYDEFVRFENWFANDLMHGALTFAFPRINGNDSTDLVEYRFVDGSSYSWENTSGKMITVSMEWETV